MPRTVAAIFESPNRASAAVDSLVASGVERDQVSVAMGESFRDRHFAPNRGDVDTYVMEKTGDNLSLEGLAAGATLGGVLGALVAGLAATGAVVASGGAVLAAGPAVAALAGAGAGGATGGLLGGLIGFGIPEERARRYDDVVRTGRGLVVAARAASTADERRIKQILADAGGADISLS